MACPARETHARRLPGVTSTSAAEAATAEAEIWAGLIDTEPEGWDDVAPTELATVGLFDPAEDLTARAARWSHELPDHRLGSLAAFGAGLAVAEAEAWEQDEPHIATRANEDRRFLLSDRLIHWAVPWLHAVAAADDDTREIMLAHREALLELGDDHRVAPALAGTEGTVPPGHDAFGPLDPPGALGTVPAGMVLLGNAAGTPTGRLADLHEAAASEWRGLAWLHPGSEQLWTDLAARADATSSLLRTRPG